jgi:hypothetical protein
MPDLAEQLAFWAQNLQPTAGDLQLADRALVDTVAVAIAAREDPIAHVVRGMPDAARWAALAHSWTTTICTSLRLLTSALFA